ncbi:MAG: SAM-dependent methyltransferase [Clostridium sp.]|uniref:TRM11 family SAM-dependent methyltransferase n=1 Tax=Clostridium sp. TaxID=1506 RepID=UPI003032DC56
MIKKYFYNLNYPKYEKDICDMEMKYLFEEKVVDKYIFSDRDIKTSRSPFIKEKISVKYVEETLEAIVRRIVEDEISYEQFKVCYIKLEGGDVEYKDRLQSIREIGLIINGESEMYDPKVLLGVTKVEGKWIFGEYEKNDYQWHIHDRKPHSYSNSLGLRLSRALVNIAVGDDLHLKLVDPCCGVGTVVIDAMSMGIDAKGFEINKPIAKNAKDNLNFFGYDNVITTGDMREIDEKFDVAIIDLPYGVFTPTTVKEQTDIITTARNIADKLVLVTFEDMDNIIKEAGFEIVDKCFVCKGKFKRHINICY